MNRLLLVISMAILLFTSCTPSRYVRVLTSGGGPTPKYRVFPINTTSSLLQVRLDELAFIKSHYPQYKISSMSGGLYSVYGEYDWYDLTRYDKKELTIGFDVTPFIMTSRADHHKMTEEEAKEIVKAYLLSGLLLQHYDDTAISSISSWPCYYDNELNVLCPALSGNIRYKFSFGYWVHRLYLYGQMSQTDMEYHK